MTSMRIQAVIFDRDNTLGYFDQVAMQLMAAEVAAVAPRLSAAYLLKQWQNWPGPWPQRVEDEMDFWRGFVAVVGQPFALDDAQSERLCLLFHHYYICFRVFADVHDCLVSLKAAGLRLALLTNFELPSIDRTLASAGVDPSMFDVLLSRTMLKVSKPAPAAFYAVAEALGMPVERCAFVDDIPEHVAAARTLGMRALWIDRSRTSHDLASDTICSLEQLPEILFSSSDTLK